VTLPAATIALWLVGAYLLGSIPTSLLAARWVGGMDLRTFGSGNLGATNLYRALGMKVAAPVGLFDLLKGTVPVVLARAVFHGQLAGVHAEWWPLAVGLAAVAGHVWSPFVRFHGGKGVATAAGVFAGLAPLAILVALVVWVVVVWLSGYVSLGSMLAATAFACSVPLLYPRARLIAWAAAGIALFIVFTHRANIRRLLAGNENRFGARRASAPPGASA
jgi:glycerol-3-phosphate acyltransferase PlsY